VVHAPRDGRGHRTSACPERNARSPAQELRVKTHLFLCSDNTILIRFWKGIGTARRNLFWLSDEQWKRIEPHLPTDVRGVERADDRRVIDGIVQVPKSGCRWCDCPPEYGTSTTIYNRFVRWARRGVWENLFAGNGRSINTQMIDSPRISRHTATRRAHAQASPAGP
jgi:transposase